ncbi:hypothetical protein AVEN_268641-1 [Araneus ventricosus]|uniref:DUF4371 domain-containing protein n=1 Tax=Araneus ventricosus TaxID=182803 RepID=A0A4Y2RX86_ARAVE|nr:hypothetical protein AVEN_268641-1 [Araneus ventricosus]
MFRKHENCTYHKKSVLIAENIKSIVAKKSESVINQVNAQRRLDIEKNRKRLIPIIQTIRFCGRQQIAVRGHREGERIGLEEPEKNDGNFRSLLRYRANSGDNDLKDQLMNSGGKSMYTSYFIQNELINTFGHLIQSQIVTNVRKSIFYSVLADETTDIIQIEQFSLLKEIAAKLDIKEEIPRVRRLQTARNNVPYSTEEEYYRRGVYVPYLDDFCNSLKERFESHKETVASLQHILPEFCTKTDFYSLEAALNFYKEDLSHKEQEWR